MFSEETATASWTLINTIQKILTSHIKTPDLFFEKNTIRELKIRLCGVEDDLKHDLDSIDFKSTSHRKKERKSDATLIAEIESFEKEMEV